MVRSYFGSLPYAGVGRESQLRRRHGEEHLKVALESLCKWTQSWETLPLTAEGKSSTCGWFWLCSVQCDTSMTISICLEIDTAWIFVG